jgi:hypothetical protein
MKAMRQTVRGWHLQLKCDKELSDLSNMFDPVLRGWANYYGRFYPTAMNPFIMAACKRVSRALDAAQVQASCAWGNSCSSSAWTQSRKCTQLVRALEEGIYSHGSMRGAG